MQRLEITVNAVHVISAMLYKAVLHGEPVQNSSLENAKSDKIRSSTATKLYRACLGSTYEEQPPECPILSPGVPSCKNVPKQPSTALQK